MVTIPITSPEGVYVGFVGRSVEGKEFKNTPGLPRSKTLFNISKAKRFDTVYVVESSFDAIRLEQVGVHAIATLGASVNKTQKQLLKKYFNNIIMLADNDEAGQSMAQRLKDDLGSIVITPKLPSGVKDVSDLSDLELSNFVSGLDDPLAVVLQ
jgi:DNA primase